jgi:tetratricopeptide (TPR) repeat protein
MLANVYAKFKSDFNTAMKYYDKALEINPDDFLAISNIGANLYVADRLEEAERYLLHSHSLNPNFANTSMALAQLYYRKEEIQKSMEFAILAVKNSKSDHPLKDFSIKFLTDISGSYIGNKKGTKIFNEFRQYLEERSGKRIDLELDTTIAMFAKIEIAEYYNRDRHIIKHQKFSAGMEHLLMHELVHLEFILDARQSNANKLFTSNNQNKANFLCDIDSFILKLNKKGFTGETVEHVIDKMFVGLNLQLFNTPIDLFIEDYLFNHFPGLRPVQFFSLLEMYKSYCDGLNIPDRGNFAPALVSEVNVILILVMFYQFTDLYGIDLTPKIKCSNYEKRISKELYNDWLYERYSHIGGSEYDLLEKWGKVLKLQSYFSLIDEEDHLSAIEDEEIQQSIKDDYMRILDKIANDPYNTKDPEFIEHEGKTLDLNDSPAGSMAVTMYCVDAMTTFFGQPYEFIQKVGFEIAALGAYGIDHNDNEKKFHLSSLPDKTFTGLHLLSIMYVAFQHIDPNLNVGVDFRSEFEMAKTLFGNK